MVPPRSSIATKKRNPLDWRTIFGPTCATALAQMRLNLGKPPASRGAFSASPPGEAGCGASAPFSSLARRTAVRARAVIQVPWVLVARGAGARPRRLHALLERGEGADRARRRISRAPGPINFGTTRGRRDHRQRDTSKQGQHGADRFHRFSLHALPCPARSAFESRFAPRTTALARLHALG